MDVFKDAGIIVVIVNIINTVTNIFWSIKLKNIQGNKEILASLREENEDLKETIDAMKKKKDQYKHQYLNQVYHSQRLAGKVEVCEKHHSNLK